MDYLINKYLIELMFLEAAAINLLINIHFVNNLAILIKINLYL